MIEPRLRKVAALLDEARTLLVEIVDERPSDATPRDLNHIDAARQFINSASVYVESANGAAALKVVD